MENKQPPNSSTPVGENTKDTLRKRETREEAESPGGQGSRSEYLDEAQTARRKRGPKTGWSSTEMPE